MLQSKNMNAVFVIGMGIPTSPALWSCNEPTNRHYFLLLFLVAANKFSFLYLLHASAELKYPHFTQAPHISAMEWSRLHWKHWFDICHQDHVDQLVVTTSWTWQFPFWFPHKLTRLNCLMQTYCGMQLHAWQVQSCLGIPVYQDQRQTKFNWHLVWLWCFYPLPCSHQRHKPCYQKL